MEKIKHLKIINIQDNNNNLMISLTEKKLNQMVFLIQIN